MQYGDTTITKEPVNDFQGTNGKGSDFASILDSFWGRTKTWAIEQMNKKNLEEEYETDRKKMFGVNARDIKLH